MLTTLMGMLLGLLIVPYGIETMNNQFNRENLELLIVPYGIETVISLLLIVFVKSFNRTLWN